MKLKKKRGTIEIFIASTFLIVIVLIVTMNIRLKEIKVTKNLIEDGLVASNLASCVVDLKEYGTTNNIVINDFNNAYSSFCTSLKDNLNLNDNYEPKNKKLINSKIDIDDFIIYNVINKDINVKEKKKDGSINTYTLTNAVNVAKTPDGTLIKSTTVYSKIKFKVRGYLKTEHEVFKDKSVDIVNK